MKLHLLKPRDYTIRIQEEEKQFHESHDGARKRDSKRLRQLMIYIFEFSQAHLESDPDGR